MKFDFDAYFAERAGGNYCTCKYVTQGEIEVRGAKAFHTVCDRPVLHPAYFMTSCDLPETIDESKNNL